MAELMFPDIGGSFLRGQMIGTQQRQQREGEQRRNRLADLAGQAWNASPDQRDAIVGQAYGVDVQGGAALASALGTDDERRARQLVGRARWLKALPEEHRAQAYASMVPELQRMGLNAPAAYDQTVMQAIDSLASAGSAGNVVHSQRVGEDGFIYNTMRDGSLVNTGIRADRQMWFRDHPGMDPQLVGKDGSVMPVGQPQMQPMQAPQQQFAPPVQGQHPNVEQVLAEANARAQRGEPPEQIEAWMQQQLSQSPQAGAPMGAAMPAGAPMGSPPLPRLDYTGGGLARPSEAQTAAEVEAARQQAQLAALPQELAIRTQAALEQKAGEAAVASEAKSAEAQAELDATLHLYETAMEGLRSGLDGAVTGPVVGRLPAVTANQQIAAGGVAAMAPVLKQLFRAAGEGTFTDKDQELLLDMVPTRTDLPEARAAKIQNIDRIVRAKLRGPQPRQGSQQPSQGGWGIQRVR